MFSGKCRENVEGKATVARAAVAHRSADQQVLWHTMREVAVSEYNSEGPKAAIWLMDFEYPQLTGVAKCELNTWEWQNSKVASATLSIPYESTLLMQGTHYPTSNLVMPQLRQMISRLQMPNITYVHTAQRETIE